MGFDLAEHHHPTNSESNTSPLQPMYLECGSCSIARNGCEGVLTSRKHSLVSYVLLIPGPESFMYVILMYHNLLSFRATTKWSKDGSIGRKEKYPVAPFLEIRPHWKLDAFLPEVEGCVYSTCTNCNCITIFPKISKA